MELSEVKLDVLNVLWIDMVFTTARGTLNAGDISYVRMKQIVNEYVLDVIAPPSRGYRVIDTDLSANLAI